MGGTRAAATAYNGEKISPPYSLVQNIQRADGRGMYNEGAREKKD
jgi:hypothetical protein